MRVFGWVNTVGMGGVMGRKMGNCQNGNALIFRRLAGAAPRNMLNDVFFFFFLSLLSLWLSVWVVFRVK